MIMVEHDTQQGMLSRVDCVTGSIADEQIPDFLHQKLRPSLPYSLPLYRRCQFYLREPKNDQQNGNDTTESTSAGPEIWVGLAKLSEQDIVHENSTNTNKWLKSWLSQPELSPKKSVQGSKAEEHWLAAYVDLRHTGETQVWLFGSWEPSFDPDAQPLDQSSSTYQIHKTLFQALYKSLRTRHIPTSPIEPPPRWQYLLTSGKIVSKPYNRSKVLFGGVMKALWPYLTDDVVNPSHTKASPVSNTTAPKKSLNPTTKQEACIARQDRPYLKYILPISSHATTPPPPTDLVFRPLSTPQLQMMLDRTVIPRTLETLQSLTNIGLFSTSPSTSDPIAWGVLSKDASISSLHTEPEFRGRGLALHIARKLVELTDQGFETGTEGEGESLGYVHADVSSENMPSRRVFDKLGGRVLWSVGWIEVILGEE